MQISTINSRSRGICKNLSLAISRLERMDLSIYGGGVKSENVLKVHPAGASRPEGPRVCRKEREKREDEPRERSNFWAIAGQFRRVPNPPPGFGGGPQPPPRRPPCSRSTAETDVARDRAILHPSSFGVASFCTRVQNSTRTRARAPSALSLFCHPRVLSTDLPRGRAVVR